jgi:hypothetical protein
MMGGEEGLHDAWGGAPGPDDVGLAWDAAERHAVTLLREALPEAQAVPAPAGELTAAAARFRSAARKWPYRELARAAWGQRPRKRWPAGDGGLRRVRRQGGQLAGTGAEPGRARHR